MSLEDDIKKAFGIKKPTGNKSIGLQEDNNYSQKQIESNMKLAINHISTENGKKRKFTFKDKIVKPVGYTDTIKEEDKNLEYKWVKPTPISINLDSMPKEYWNYCDSSEAKRAWHRAKFEKVHRGSTEDLKREVKQRSMELDMIKLMKKEKEPWYRECMSELKEVLKERAERLK